MYTEIWVVFRLICVKKELNSFLHKNPGIFPLLLYYFKVVTLLKFVDFRIEISLTNEVIVYRVIIYSNPLQAVYSYCKTS